MRRDRRRERHELPHVLRALDSRLRVEGGQARHPTRTKPTGPAGTEGSRPRPDEPPTSLASEQLCTREKDPGCSERGIKLAMSRRKKKTRDASPPTCYVCVGG